VIPRKQEKYGVSMPYGGEKKNICSSNVKKRPQMTLSAIKGTLKEIKSTKKEEEREI